MKAVAVIFGIFFTIWIFLEFILFAKAENKVIEIQKELLKYLKAAYKDGNQTFKIKQKIQDHISQLGNNMEDNEELIGQYQNLIK